jgi:hypothetical protein
VKEIERLHGRFLGVIRKRYGSFPAVRLEVGFASEFPQDRDFAYTAQDINGALSIVVAPKLAHETPARKEGVLLHEFGHAILMAAGKEHSEADADDMALTVFGTPIFYDDALDAQTTDPIEDRAFPKSGD